MSIMGVLVVVIALLGIAILAYLELKGQWLKWKSNRKSRGQAAGRRE